VNDAPLFSAEEAEAVDAVGEAVWQAARLLPYLKPLARLVHAAPDARVASAAIFASGRLLVNPGWFLGLSAPDRIFVAAHEMLHLALQSHERCAGPDGRIANIADEYVINDLLRDQLGLDVPPGGFDCLGMASFPTEKIVAALQARRAKGEELADDPWSAPPADNGLPDTAPLDVFDALVERLWFPEEDGPARERATASVALGARRAMELGLVRERLDVLGGEPPAGSALQRTLDEQLSPGWKGALHRWLEEAAPAKRRGRRHRADWVLDVLVDTTAPVDAFLDAIRAIGAVIGIDSLRLHYGRFMEILPLEALDDHAVPAGRLDIVQALDRLAADPSVAAALVISAADEDPSAGRLPYPVLWICHASGDAA